MFLPTLPFLKVYFCSKWWQFFHWKLQKPYVYQCQSKPICKILMSCDHLSLLDPLFLAGLNCPCQFWHIILTTLIESISQVSFYTRGLWRAEGLPAISASWDDASKGSPQLEASPGVREFPYWSFLAQKNEISWEWILLHILIQIKWFSIQNTLLVDVCVLVNV